MKQLIIFLFCGIFGFAVPSIVNAQTSDSIYNYGLWEAFGTPLNKIVYPQIKGRLCNFDWKTIEQSDNNWTWISFDSALAVRAKDSLPFIFMVYTEEGAPDWIYTKGVPKVYQRDANNQVVAYSPYYRDSLYKSLFERMIATVRAHVQTLPDSVRRYMIGVQGCFGSTGDYIGYKGTVDSQYALTSQQFYDLFKEFSSYYYNQYRNTFPKIYLLSNPQNNGSDQMNWLIANCPNGWIKCGSLGKGFQLNDEVDKASWLYSLLNYQQNGEYVRSRSELQGNPDSVGWWAEHSYRNMFALMTYCVFWGLDWSNQTNAQITDGNFDIAFSLYNKYAGQKDPSTATNAICALRDGLDASDTIRFPQNIYGTANRADTNRYKAIVNNFKKYGAMLEDPVSATLAENANLVATGTNDVGWNVFSGSYDRYLHQLRANLTSVGYWNVTASADSNAVYGKFARGINSSSSKNALYFDVDSTFTNNTRTDINYPVIIDITYLDKGTGGFQLFYDAKTSKNKPSLMVLCTNTGTWKKASVTLFDAYFKNRALTRSDFYINALNAQTVLFSIVELSRPNLNNPQVGLSVSGSLQYDTVCTKSGIVKSFALNGSFLDGSNIIIHPLKEYSYSLFADSAFKDSLIIGNYGTSISKTIYVKFNPNKKGVYSGTILISGGGYNEINISAYGSGINSRPALSAAVTNVLCNNDKTGAINLTTTGGNGPFTFTWANDILPAFKATTEDISDLPAALYTVTVTSFAACTVSASYPISQPLPLVVTMTKDSDIVCKNGTTTVTVTASGGMPPYQGVGVFTVSKGNITKTVKDANGCSEKTQTIPLANGTLTAPDKPASLSGNDVAGVCNGGTFNYLADSVATAITYTWQIPVNTAVVQKNNIGNNINLFIPPSFASGKLSVTADNACGSSSPISKTISNTPDAPAGISGPVFAIIGQIGLIYKVINPVPGITYTWSVSRGIKITAGQGTSVVTVTWGLLAGKVSVTAGNGCGASDAAVLDVGVFPFSATAQSYTLVGQNINEPNSNAPELLPNPAHNFTDLVFLEKYPQACSVELTDVAGKILFRTKINSVAGENRLTINIASYAKAVYYIILTKKDETKTTLTLVKQ